MLDHEKPIDVVRYHLQNILGAENAAEIESGVRAVAEARGLTGDELESKVFGSMRDFFNELRGNKGLGQVISNLSQSDLAQCFEKAKAQAKVQKTGQAQKDQVQAFGQDQKEPQVVQVQAEKDEITLEFRAKESESHKYEIDVLKTKLEKLEKASSALKDQSLILEDEIHDWEQYCMVLEKEQNRLKQENYVLTARTVHIGQDNFEFQWKIVPELEAKVLWLEEELKARIQSDFDHKALKAQNEELESEILDLEAQNKAQVWNITLMKSHLAEYEAQTEYKIQVLEVQNQDYEAQIKSLKDRNKIRYQADLDYKAQIVSLKARNESEMAQLKSKITYLEKDLEAQHQANLDYQAQVEALKAKSEAQNDSENRQLNVQNTELTAQHQDYKDQIEALKAQNEVRKQAQNQTNLDYESQIQSLEAQKEALNKELKELRKTWRVSGVLMNTLMQEAIEMRKSQAALRDELANLKSTETGYKLQKLPQIMDMLEDKE